MKLIHAFITFAVLLAPTQLVAQHVLVEAEQFASLGGWDLDQQSMDQMGSPYLLAHGLGVPVKDAVTKVTIAEPGTYRVWVRTRDWVAPWKVPGAPGKFQLLVNGKPLAETFGTKNAAWHWHDGGPVELTGEVTLALHDLTGFEGRCDAICFTRQLDFTPPNEQPAMTTWRREQLGLQGPPADGGEFDLVVVGGGVAGTAAAVSAARNGLTVALIQDRPLLGGNSSSEVRVWPEGHTRQKPFRHIGEIVEELCPPKRAGSGNAKGADVYDDERKLRVARAEPRITLMLEHRVNEVESVDKQIRSVTAQNTRSAKRTRVRGKLFADCTGDGTVGYLAGADFEVSREGNMGASNLWNVLDQADPKQVLHCECKDKDLLSVLTAAGNVVAPFPRLEWALDLSKKPFPGRAAFKAQWSDAPLSNLGGWFWESGFDKDPINDIELIRDLNLRAMYGAWDTLKNIDAQYPNHRLGWSAFIAGKRESRRLLGDVVLKADDFRNGTQFPDPAFPNTWHIDIHVPHPDFKAGLKGEEFISVATTGKEYSYRGPYWAPYRCLYSRNISNLFMAGRDISVEREAIGPIRVMRTCGMMGEIVGKAAWICLQHQTTPRGVYQQYLTLLQDLMNQPGAMRRESFNAQLALPPGVTVPARSYLGLDPATLPGIVIDDEASELHGNWTPGTSLAGFIGDGYHYSGDQQATARFPFSVTRAGRYEMRIAWQPHANRAKSLAVTVRHADGEQTLTIDQTQPADETSGFRSLGVFRFDETKNFAVVFKVAGAKGTAHIDAVQLIPAK
ncbi:MAG: FAD-dependent oxidoreductase [Planctomycetaceae bacterium]|nr:FAD-dependent oxidoreductase [Planctomycetaceae bacterium]